MYSDLDQMQMPLFFLNIFYIFKSLASVRFASFIQQVKKHVTKYFNFKCTFEF